MQSRRRASALWATAAIVLLLLLLASARTRALTLQAVGTFDQPIYVTSDPVNPDRLFVVERKGKIELVQGGTRKTFADLTSLVDCPPSGCAGERGLMSIAFSPGYAGNGHLYVDYADNATGEIHIDELTATGDAADPLSRRSLLTIPHSERNNHNGGQLQFGPDGYLYISTGDGGGSNDELHNAQDPNSLLGKILRIDPTPSGFQPYTVPLGNPFPGASPPANTVWNLGLRNPFRFSFDRLTGGMAIGDVGQREREEVDWAPSIESDTVGGSGANYGWNCREGLILGPADDLPPGECATGDFVDPVFDYPHRDPGDGGAFGCSIIGGYVVRDDSLGSLSGRYVYTDFCNGRIRSLQLPATAEGTASGDRSEGLTVPSPVSFGEDSCGRVYVVAEEGAVSRLEGATPAACPSFLSPQPPQTTRPALLPTLIGVKAERGKVERGDPAEIVAWVSPCKDHRGDLVRLLRGGRPNGSKYLSRACTVRFHPRIRHRTIFQAAVFGDETYLPAESRRLTIKIDHRRRR
jgi:Glucose / Sorbosone dehydrogenase